MDLSIKVVYFENRFSGNKTDEIYLSIRKKVDHFGKIEELNNLNLEIIVQKFEKFPTHFFISKGLKKEAQEKNRPQSEFNCPNHQNEYILNSKNSPRELEQISTSSTMITCLKHSLNRAQRYLT